MSKICNAKTKSGAECRCRPMPNGRCRLHGGATPRTNQNAVTHGIYSKRITEQEYQMFHSMQVGSVDHELYLMRILLSRALAREAKLNGQLQLREVTQNSDAGASVPRKSRSLKVADCSADIDRLIGRIESLEKTRMALAE